MRASPERETHTFGTFGTFGINTGVLGNTFEDSLAHLCRSKVPKVRQRCGKGAEAKTRINTGVLSKGAKGAGFGKKTLKERRRVKLISTGKNPRVPALSEWIGTRFECLGCNSVAEVDSIEDVKPKRNDTEGWVFVVCPYCGRSKCLIPKYDLEGYRK